MTFQKGHKINLGRIPWNKNLTSETDERVKNSTEKTSKSLKRMYKEGKFKIWSQGLTKDTDERVKEIGNKNKQIQKEKFKDENYKLNFIRRGFKKGQPSLRKGIKLTGEERKIVSESTKEAMQNPDMRKEMSKIKKQQYKDGLVVWNKDLTKETDERVKNNILNMTKWKKENINGKTLEEIYGEEKARKIKETHLKNGEYKRSSERMKNGGAFKALAGNKKPTKPEKIMMDIIKENNLPFNYVGKGQIVFKGENHSFNPDFLSKNPKHIIEVFGDYWHRNTQKDDAERINIYTKYGYKTLIIWEHELKSPIQVLNKINEFIKLK